MGELDLCAGQPGYVPDNQDTFIAALRRASGVNAIAAACAALASMCAAYAFIKSIWG
jgi:hypothetical protein